MVYNFFTSVIFLFFSFNATTTKTTKAPVATAVATALTETESVYNSIKSHSASMPGMECFTKALNGFNRLKEQGKIKKRHPYCYRFQQII